MGTPEFAVPALQALHGAGHDVAAVYTQPPRPAGRGKKLQKSAIHLCADALGLTVEHPVNFNADEAKDTFKAYNADIAVVAAYGLILPRAVLDMCPLGFLNIHASLLPRWRGAAPIQRAIEEGATRTGVTIMQMEAGLDTGPMSLKGSVHITPSTTAGALHDSLAQMGATMTALALEQFEAGTLAFEQQNDDEATYAKKISKDEAALEFSALNADQVRCKIHALSPFPGAFIVLDGQRIKLLEVETVDSSGQAGTVLDDAMTIACAQGAIRPRLVQPAGKAAMRVEAFLRGKSVAAGTQV